MSARCTECATSCPLANAMDGRIVCYSAIVACQLAAIYETVKRSQQSDSCLSVTASATASVLALHLPLTPYVFTFIFTCWATIRSYTSRPTFFQFSGNLTSVYRETSLPVNTLLLQIYRTRPTERLALNFFLPLNSQRQAEYLNRPHHRHPIETFKRKLSPVTQSSNEHVTSAPYGDYLLLAYRYL